MTEILPINRESLMKAAEFLKMGEIVAFPTETVYGLGADGFNPEAVKKIFKAKGRPQDNPLILHISRFEEIEDIAEELTPVAWKIIQTFMPGPITIVVKSRDIVPLDTRAGLPTVAIRMPINPDAQRLLREFGRAIAAPSANISGKPSPTTAEAVFEDMQGKIPLILDGGETDIGLESTVLDVTGANPVILRPGKISFEDLKKIFPETSIAGSIGAGETPKAPGMKYRHYAPKAPMKVYKGEHSKVIGKMQIDAENAELRGKKAGVICYDEDVEFFKGFTVLSLGGIYDMEMHSHRLFQILRDMDSLGVDEIFSVAENEDNLGRAFMNRIGKAASGNIIEV